MKKHIARSVDLIEFREVYDLYWDKLYALAFNYFRDHATAEELVQEVFIHLWEKRKQLSHVSDLSAYLFRSMKNKIYDQYDRLAVQEKLKQGVARELKVESCATEEDVNFQDTLALLNEGIAKLPPTTQNIFRMSRFDRYTNQEIATQTNLSAKAVEYHITLALRQLHQYVDHLVCITLIILLGAS